MDLVEVDPIRLQSSQARVDRLNEPASRIATSIAALAHVKTGLRRQHNLISSPAQCPADDLFGLPVGVNVRGVDEVDAVLDRNLDHANAFLVIAVTFGA